MKTNSALTNLTVIILLTFNVVFPKGGIKVDGVPLTWGVLLLSSLGITLALKKVYNLNFNINKKRIIILYSWIPFQLVGLTFIFFNGYQSGGELLSFIFNLYFLPWIMLWGIGDKFDSINLETLWKVLKFSIAIVSIYGIFLFCYKYTYGEFFEIPYLTINYDDMGMLENKYINRNGIYKLISTYNNGNIYGVCILMLLPLFCKIEKNKTWHWIVKFSLLLTLSRTVWIGLIIYELLMLFAGNFSLKSLVYKTAVIFIITFGILNIINLIGVDFDFIIDPNLGGRAYQISTEPLFIPGNQFSGISEIVYAGFLFNFGIIGLCTYLIAIMVGIVFYIKEKRKRLLFCEKKLAAGMGYFIYVIISASDGCMLLIPTMIFFWFLLLILTSRNRELL